MEQCQEKQWECSLYENLKFLHWRNNFDKFLIMLVLLCILNVYVLVCIYIKGHIYLLNKEFETLNVLLTTETF